MSVLVPTLAFKPTLAFNRTLAFKAKEGNMTGYLIAITNPNFSGVATAHFAKDRDAIRKPTADNVTRVPVEAGYGVRQLVAMFKDAGLYPIQVNEDMPAVEYTVDEYGLLATASIVDGGDDTN